MSGWQPIETAPKDGTVICVVSFDGGKLWKPDFAWWDSRSGRWENGEPYDQWPLTHWVGIDGLPACSAMLAARSEDKP